MPRTKLPPHPVWDCLDDLNQDDIPPRLAQRGWCKRDGHIVRLDARGDITAWVMRVDLEGPVRTGSVSYWTGGIEAPRRWLWDPYCTPIQAMWAVEGAEEQGPLSDDWGNDPCVPFIGDVEFDGWQHVVKDKRHEWRRQGANGQPVIVRQLPPERFNPHLKFAIWLGTDCVCADGKPLIFDNPLDTIIEAEKRFVQATTTVLPVALVITE